MLKAAIKAGTLGVFGGLVLFPMVALEAVVRDQVGGDAEDLLPWWVLISSVSLWMGVGFLGALLANATTVRGGIMTGAFSGAIAWLVTAFLGLWADTIWWQIREPAMAMALLLLWMAIPVNAILGLLGLDWGILGFGVSNPVVALLGALLGAIPGGLGGLIGRRRPAQPVSS